MTNPRILVFTVPSWNSKIGANSWASLLEKYNNKYIANICIREEYPDSNVCSRYFVISENRIIKSVFNRKVKTGYEFDKQSNNNENTKDLSEHNIRYQKMTRKRNYFFLLLRELIWKFGKWKTKELDEFLDSFKPDIILHSMEGYIHLNRIIEYSIKRTKAKAIGYIWDDNFTYMQSSKIGYKIYRFFQRKSLKKLAKKTQGFFSISQKTKVEADDFFNIDSKILTKPLYSIPTISDDTVTEPIKFIYTGNLLYGRKESLFAFSEVIGQLPQDKIYCDVYTQTLLSGSEIEFLENNRCFVHKPISQKEVLKLQRESDVLLFLEALDGPNAKTARLSFSTKITDYLSAGKAIFAIGNGDTAPIEYFLENKSAFVATDRNQLKEMLVNLTDNPDLIKQYAIVARECAVKNHNPQTIQELFDNEILTVLNN